MAQLRDIIAAISGLAGFEASEVDTAAIPDTDVRGYIIDRPQGAREVLAVLRSLYRFDVQDTARLHFVGRGRDGETPPNLTEDTDTLASAQRVRTQETELPRIVTLSYLDAERQLEFGNATAQRSLVHRGLGAISSRQRYDLRAYIVLTPDQARGMVERMLYAYWRERDRMTLNLPPRYLAISPGDFVSFLDRRNRRMLGRVERQDIGADLTTELEVTVVESTVEPPLTDSTSRFVLDARTGEGLPDIDAPEPTPLIAPGRRTDIDGRLRMVSVSALSDADVDVYGRTVRSYATLERYELASWDNASIRVSQTRTGTQRTAIRGALSSQIIGRLIDPPSDNWSPDFIDRDGRMTIRVIDETARIRLRALRPTNEMEFVSERSRLVILRRDGEAAVLAYRFLEQSDDDSQVLIISRLLRGLRGTEHLDRDYTGGETVVFLIPGERPAYVAINKVFRNRQLFFQAHLEATPLGTIPHTLIPAALRPYSPAHLMVEGEAGDVTATWVRRTRMGGEDDLLDGIEDVPNVEPVERYNVDVLAADGTVIHHVADVKATEYVYPLTQRQADESGLEVEYRFEIGLDENGRGGRQDVAETILSSSLFSGNVLTMGRAGELLGVDWWASSGTERTVRHAVFLMDAGTLLNVDSVLAEPSEPVTFDGRTGENFVTHDYVEPVPFAAGDTILIAVEGAINVVPSGAMRDPRIRPPFGFAVELDEATDDGVATTLGAGMFTMRLRYRMTISEADARTVRVAQVGWAGPGTPSEVTFTPEPLREPNRLRFALHLPAPDVLGFARATPLRFGIRLGTDRGLNRPSRAVGLQPWALSGVVRARRMRAGLRFIRQFRTFRELFSRQPPWRLIFRNLTTDIWEIRPQIIKSIVEPVGTLKVAFRFRQPDVAAGNVNPPRLTQWVRLRRVGKRLIYEVPFWLLNEGISGQELDRIDGRVKLRGEVAPRRAVIDGSSLPNELQGPGFAPVPLPSHWVQGRATAWVSDFSMWPWQVNDVGRFVGGGTIHDPISQFEPWGYQGNLGAGSVDLDIISMPRPLSIPDPNIPGDFIPLWRALQFDSTVVQDLQFELSFGTNRVRWEWQEHYGLPPVQEIRHPWTIPPTGIAEMSEDLDRSIWREGILRIEGPRSGALQLGVRLNRPVYYVEPTPLEVQYTAADLGTGRGFRSLENSGGTYHIPIEGLDADVATLNSLPKLPSHWMENQVQGAALSSFFMQRSKVRLKFHNVVDGSVVRQSLDPTQAARFAGSITSTPVIEDKTADYVIVAGDRGKTIRLTGDTARTFTLPEIDLPGEVSPAWWVRVANASTADLSLAPGMGQQIGTGGDTLFTNPVTIAPGVFWIVGNATVEVSVPTFHIDNNSVFMGAAELTTDPVSVSWAATMFNNDFGLWEYAFDDTTSTDAFLRLASANATITLKGPAVPV